MPQRIQRKRTKGWRMPPGAVYVGRPTRWGNPWRIGQWVNYTASDSLKDYRRWMAMDLSMLSAEGCYGRPPTSEEIRENLRGKDLMCWCPLNQPCHADVLLEIANRE